MSDEEIHDDPEEALLASDEEMESRGMDILTLQANFEEEKVKAERYLSNWQKSEADLANFKKRNEQERSEFIKYSAGTIISNFLPILDDIDLALASAPPEIAESQWINGIKLIQRKLTTILESQGVSEIKALGEVFDPRYHEAVAQCPGDEGKVIEVTRKGYQLHDRVIRPASVLVGNGQ